MYEEIGVSIICNTYNHEKYIAQTLDSFIMQQTSFKFEILLHDDASTDKTADIIREYEAKYPEIVKPIYQTENQHSKNVKITSIYHFPRVRGKYIAMCEGDDFWIDPLKLQKQYDAMESHPEVDICTHNAKKVHGVTGELLEYMRPEQHDAVLTLGNVIGGGGGYVATNSLFYRASINENIPEFRQFWGLDYALQIHGAIRGGMLYLNDCMSAYRYMVPGSWTLRVEKKRDQFAAHHSKMKSFLGLVDEYLNNEYHDIIELRLLKDEFLHVCSIDDYKTALNKKFAPVHRTMSKKALLKMRVKAFLPFVFAIKRAILKRRNK